MKKCVNFTNRINDFLSNAFLDILLHDGNIIESIYFIFPDYKFLLLIHNTIVAILISNVS